jgi:hypothetical protein
MHNQTRLRANRLWLICALLLPVTNLAQLLAPQFHGSNPVFHETEMSGKTGFSKKESVAHPPWK